MCIELVVDIVPAPGFVQPLVDAILSDVPSYHYHENAHILIREHSSRPSSRWNYPLVSTRLELWARGTAVSQARPQCGPRLALAFKLGPLQGLMYQVR